jgi:hypothetical protein
MKARGRTPSKKFSDRDSSPARKDKRHDKSS